MPSFLKVDVDAPWDTLGLEGLLVRRTFKLMVIEIDLSWAARRLRTGLSAADRLTWFARKHGYASFVKVPCKTSPQDQHRQCIYHCRDRSAWYYPLASPSVPFVPSAANAGRESLGNVHDLMLVDARRARWLDNLVELGRNDCHNDPALRVFDQIQQDRAREESQGGAIRTGNGILVRASGM